MDERVFCPSCGAAVDHRSPTCPSCNEAMPSPKTVVGFADLPKDAPEGPSEPRGPMAPELAYPKKRTWSGSFSPTLPEEGEEPAPETRAFAGPEDVAAGEPPASADRPAAPEEPQPDTKAFTGQADGGVQAPAAPNIKYLDSKPGTTNPGWPGAPAQPQPKPAEPSQAHPPQVQAQPSEQTAGQAPAQPVAQQPPAVEPQAEQPAAHQPGTSQQAPYPAAVQYPMQPPPQGPTAPHEGPPAEALAAPPAAPAAQQGFVYGQAQQAPAVQPAAQEPAVAPTAPQGPEASTDEAPTDTRKGLVWRTVAGGALLSWTLLFGAAATYFVLLHLGLLTEYGFGNAHVLTYTTFALSAGALAPATLLLAASISCLSGRGWPRALAVVGAVAHAAWTAATLIVLVQDFEIRRMAMLGMVACGLSALFTFVWTGVLLAGGRWIGQSAPGKPARAVPYPSWAGPLLIVFGSMSLTFDLVQLVRVAVQVKKLSRLERYARDVFTSYPMFWATVAGLLPTILLIVAGIALIKRKRWSVGLGGAAGLLVILADLVAVIVLYVGDGMMRHGGPWIGVADVWGLFACGMAAWLAFAGAVRFGFRGNW